VAVSWDKVSKGKELGGVAVTLLLPLLLLATPLGPSSTPWHIPVVLWGPLHLPEHMTQVWLTGVITPSSVTVSDCM
jgi:hypothetical protein